MPDMTKLQFYQDFVDEVSAKLGLMVQLTVRWKWDTECKAIKDKPVHSHCDGQDPSFGQICITPRGVLAIGDWRRGLAHEVVHCRVRDHSDPEFFRVLDSLGFASEHERCYASGEVPREYCLHEWRLFRRGRRFSMKCRLCRTVETYG